MKQITITSEVFDRDLPSELKRLAVVIDGVRAGAIYECDGLSGKMFGAILELIKRGAALNTDCFLSIDGLMVVGSVGDMAEKDLANN